ncbi:Bifunctional protein PutA [Nitrospira japonica]|uniref:Bifunctional protein PutA n=1 Tax=Nitrospira japonica TaxID=1325564 RepID=A0A1W1I9A9_9BACT|nr:proline dehydrogenase family protein [Nitrospira japonica]SLM49575.1 Bifunctional protein PutA [Nitrospira japonica]
MRPAPPDLELAIRRIGEDLARLSSGQTPTVFERRWWSQAAMNMAMHDQAFKTQLFRFIDVLPAVPNDERVVSLAQEYFGSMTDRAFGLRWGLKALSATGIGARLTGHAIRSQVEQMARTFIAGSSIDDAVPVLKDLRQDGKRWSVDLLGEATISDQEADRYRDRCLEALRTLARSTAAEHDSGDLGRDQFGTVPAVQLSLKLSALTPHLDPIDPDGTYDSIAPRLRAIVDVANHLGASLIFDMEQAETKDVIIEVFTRLFSETAYTTFSHAGIALQAYHRETVRDVDRLMEWVRVRRTPVTIRLVKGAYWDSDTIHYRQKGWPIPLFEHKADTDANFEELAHTLLTHASLIRPAFGTHNLRTLACVEALAEYLGLGPEVYEYQMIFGMAEPFQHAIVERHRRLRLYAPVGELLPGMAYLVRRLLENTSNESFLRKEYVESEPLQHLLDPPAAHRTEPVLQADADTTFRNEPTLDFSQPAARDAMQQAVKTAQTRLDRQWNVPFLASSPSGPVLLSHNPAQPNEIVARIPAASGDDANRAVGASLTAWGAWRETTGEYRAEILIRAAALMRGRKSELAAWEVMECGKPWREADADVAEAIDFLEFYAREWLRQGVPTRLGRMPGELNHRVLEPRGVTVVISPWNFPLAIPTGMVSAALVTGNPVIFKPSERSSLIGLLLVSLLHEAGVPKDILIGLPGGPDIGQALARHRDVATIAFTGSKKVGIGLLRETATVLPGQRMVKRVIAEMGGKNAIIIDDTADLDEAVTGVVVSATGYAGQKCSACSRVIVHEAVYDIFVRRLQEALRCLRIGDPAEPGIDMGPVIDARAQSTILEYVEIGKREAHLIEDRKRLSSGWYVGPTLFADVKPDARIAQEEIFGPVLAVMKAVSFDEALRMANATDYGLTGGVYSRSPANLDLATRLFDVGNLYLNRPITGALVARQPFGGHRLSGIGAKAGGEDYLLQFVTVRIISEQTLRRGFAPAE